jgi:uncharacterized protein YecT (DUF1311 family)
MPDFLGQALLILLGALLSAAGFMLKRRIEGRGTIEVVEKTERLLSLRDKLKVSGTTVEELGAFESLLLGRAEVAAKVALEYEHRAVEEIESGADHGLTQTELNIRANEAAQRADVKLKMLISELESFMRPEELAALHEAQAAWENYRQKHVEFCGEQYRGGSIRPMIHGIAFESVTINRIVELDSELQERKRLHGPSS